MTVGTVTEVLIGTGTLNTDELDGSEAAMPVNPSTTLAAGWADIGYSEEGWTFEIDKTFADVLVAEEIDPVAILKTAQAISFSGASAQSSLVNIELAMGGGAIAVGSPAAGFDTYTPPATGVNDEFECLFRTSAPGTAAEDFTRDFQVPRTIIAGAVSMAHAKAPDKTLIALEFRALVPTAGAIFLVIDQTA